MAIIVSNTIILLTLALHTGFVSITPKLAEAWHNLALLGLIVAAIFVNNVVDEKWINRRWLHLVSDKIYNPSSLRLLSLFIVFLITLFSSIVYGTDAGIMAAFGLLLLGRFINVDSNSPDVLTVVKTAFYSWKSFVFAFMFSAAMLISGFKMGILTPDHFLIELTAAHIIYLLCTAIAILFWNVLATYRKPESKTKKAT